MKLQNGHTQNGHKTFCYQNGHNQNGHTAFGQNGHRGRITTKTAPLHLVKTATEGGSLPKRPHCIWSKATEGCSLPKRPHYSKMPTETETLNMIPERGKITTKTATEGGLLPKRPLYCKTASTRVTTKKSHIIYPLPVSSHARTALSGPLVWLWKKWCSFPTNGLWWARNWWFGVGLWWLQCVRLCYRSIHAIHISMYVCSKQCYTRLWN